MNEIERKINLVLSDPRFKGTYEQARKIVEELYLNSQNGNFNKGICESCDFNLNIRIPIVGSGVNVSYLCIRCIEQRQIKILSEYIERFNIKTEAF